ncbi:MAG: hypothetical protein IJB28_04100 [Bacteroidaceae bacterium]|nr:hypothetical protein [Bacteroidaceae bacterium]MBQ6799982.1 hypothetical protein [Bacteroidaceae bacterium]
MSEAELLLVNNANGCTIYTIQFLAENESEFERFYTKFKDDAEYNPDLMRIVALIDKIADMGALERYFRPEGKLNDSVCALPVIQSKLRLYCLRLSDKILILGNGGVKKTRTYNEDDTLKGYVLTLQNFEKLIKDGEKNGTITITANTIETDKTFDI